ncbi:uncharacterized protein [Spinacia oleracea]|uniref:CASP-like protein n=1 Tax=Spinacia oleracea TaxID=3562 RepID=A0A9R0IJB6_SPIOL|nr:uncharacterized protein LOC110789633 [Spinacia oleracea]
MGETKVWEYLAVSFLGTAAIVLALVAGATKIKASDITVTSGKCEYPKTPAIILGYIAAAVTFIHQIVISVFFRSAYRRRITNAKSISGAILAFIFSWISGGAGIALLVSGSYLTSRQEFLVSTGRCYILKRNLFGAAAWMVYVACFEGLLSFYFFSAKCHCSAPEAVVVPYQGGIAMANSQLDAASTNSNPKQHQYV